MYKEFLEACKERRFNKLTEIAEFLFDFYYTYSGAVFECIEEHQLLEMFRFFGENYGFQPIEYVEAFEFLPELIVAYRGGSGSKELVSRGISWTTSKEAAEGFAREPEPILLKANIKRDWVLSANGALAEILIDPDQLSKFEVLSLDEH